MTGPNPPVNKHDDPGLQPERTSLAWGRTMLSLITVSAVFLRWLPHHGLPILALFTMSSAASAAIYLTQRQRYNASSTGISQEKFQPNITGVLWTGFTCAALGILCIAMVILM